MAGSIDFSTLNHFKDGAMDYYHIKMDGRSIIEYLRQVDNIWSLYLPVLGMYTAKNDRFNPDDIFREDYYAVRLDRVDGTFRISRYGTTGWL
jgi:hypothetical protein